MDATNKWEDLYNKGQAFSKEIEQEKRLQAQIDLLHKQLDAKQLELDNKYKERNALRNNANAPIKRKLTNIERNFLEDEMQTDAELGYDEFNPDEI